MFYSNVALGSPACRDDWQLAQTTVIFVPESDGFSVTIPLTPEFFSFWSMRSREGVLETLATLKVFLPFKIKEIQVGTQLQLPGTIKNHNEPMLTPGEYFDEQITLSGGGCDGQIDSTVGWAREARLLPGKYILHLMVLMNRVAMAVAAADAAQADVITFANAVPAAAGVVDPVRDMKDALIELKEGLNKSLWDAVEVLNIMASKAEGYAREMEPWIYGSLADDQTEKTKALEEQTKGLSTQWELLGKNLKTMKDSTSDKVDAAVKLVLAAQVHARPKSTGEEPAAHARDTMNSAATEIKALIVPITRTVFFVVEAVNYVDPPQVEDPYQEPDEIQIIDSSDEDEDANCVGPIECPIVQREKRPRPSGFIG